LSGTTRPRDETKLTSVFCAHISRQIIVVLTSENVLTALLYFSIWLICARIAAARIGALLGVFKE
jgi:hypothetical protein